jgi:acyl-coenzyme A thioesterase PaaI-like protein
MLDPFPPTSPLPDSVGHRLCASCIASGACRLGLKCLGLGQDGVVSFDIVCSPSFEGGPNVAHGGWTAATLDEMLGTVAMLHKTLTVTKSLNVEFLKPVPVGQPLRGRAWNDHKAGHRWHNVGEITLAATGVVLGRATGVFSERKPDHFTNHDAWLAAELAGKA